MTGLVERLAGSWAKMAPSGAMLADDAPMEAADRIRELEAALADATARADTAPLAAAAMRDKAADRVAAIRPIFADLGQSVAAGFMVQDAVKAIRAIPLQFTPADLLAAALRLPEVAAMYHALVVWDAAHRTGKNEPLQVAFELGQSALAALTPVDASGAGELTRGRGNE